MTDQNIEQKDAVEAQAGDYQWEHVIGEDDEEASKDREWGQHVDDQRFLPLVPPMHGWDGPRRPAGPRDTDRAQLKEAFVLLIEQ